jgi:hypothetical protein
MVDRGQNQGNRCYPDLYFLWIKDIRDIVDLGQDQSQQVTPTAKYPVDKEILRIW